MSTGYVATSTVRVEAPAARVWQVITDPEAVKEFMFGTSVTTGWKVGDEIRWRGEWEGKAYEDKGRILEVVPGRRLVHTHFSPLAGKPDAPENYHTLAWSIEGDDPAVLTLTQDNNATPAEVDHSKGMWDSLVEKVKEIAEERS